LLLSELAIGSNNGTKITTLLVQFKSIVLHGDIQLGKEFKSQSLGENILDLRQRIDLTSFKFVQSTKIGDPSIRLYHPSQV
jgi:hypothetical protein